MLLLCYVIVLYIYLYSYKAVTKQLQSSYKHMTKEYDASSGMWLPTSTPAPQAQPAAPIDYSPEAVKKLCYESLVDMVANARGDIKSIAAINSLMDRLEGKPMQRTESKVEVQQVTMSPAELLRRVQFVQRVAIDKANGA